MPNPWTGVGNPYTRQEVIDRLRATLERGKAIIAAGAGTGISANTPADAKRVIEATDCVGFIGASSLERMGVEESLTSLTREFKSIRV